MQIIFFRHFVERGATVCRHFESTGNPYNVEARSAKRIVTNLLEQLDLGTLKPLQLQQEMIDQQLILGQTSAGIAIAGDLYKAQQEHKRELMEIKRETQAQINRANSEFAKDLDDLKGDAERRLKKLKESLIHTQAASARTPSSPRIEYVEIMAPTRAEVQQARKTQKKFQSRSGNIINGATNGLAAGLTTGLMTAASMLKIFGRRC